MRRRTRRLRNRLMAAFVLFALLVSALFGLAGAIVVYAVEDRFFEAMLEQEAALQHRHRASSGSWTEPRSGFMTVHTGTASFPDDLRAGHDAEPRRREIPGAQGRHYHLRVLESGPAGETYLVAEVGGQLVVRPMRRDILVLLGGSGLAALILALGIGYLLALRTARPLSELAALVERMTPERLPRGFAKAFPDDEVGVLAHGLEDLVARVEAFVEREQAFTRDASHELRTPLAVIRSAAERLAAEPALSQAGHAHLEHVHQSALRLEQTVAMLLSLAREEQAGHQPERTRVLPVLERVIVEQAPALGRNASSLAVDVPPGSVLGAPAAVLHVLLSNLVGNAFAHGAGGPVRIEVAAGRLRIVNPGGGLDDDPFRPFGKREGSAGLGLGLAIVRRLCIRYAIDLRIECAGDETTASFPVEAS